MSYAPASCLKLLDGFLARICLPHFRVTTLRGSYPHFALVGIAAKCMKLTRSEGRGVCPHALQPSWPAEDGKGAGKTYFLGPAATPIRYSAFHIDKADDDRRAVYPDPVRFGDSMVEISYDLAYGFLLRHIGQRRSEFPNFLA